MPQVKFEQINVSDLTEAQLTVVGSDRGRLLRFQGAILARAEVNKNRDEIDAAGIGEVAATLPLLAIDDEHKEKIVVGYFTDARNVGGALETDGIIFADRFPEVADDVMRGKAFLSIEADARIATCSVCGSSFANDAQYCDHLANRLSGKAVRKLSGMSAVGGGVTRNPAGTNTKFDQNRIVFMASLASESSESDKPSAPSAPSAREAIALGPAKADEQKQANAALAAQRLLAAFTSDLGAPPSLTMYRPVLSPLTYVENPAWIDELVARVTKQVTESMQAALQQAQAAVTPPPTPPATPPPTPPVQDQKREDVKRVLADKLGESDKGTEKVTASAKPVGVGLMGVALDAQTTTPTVIKASW
ncbi:MAG: hypothetical protein HY868_25495 [Chloroflexi bacterium]|nr:hypothetical protein [Chloroflexota bacterium]